MKLYTSSKISNIIVEKVSIPAKISNVPLVFIIDIIGDTKTI